MKILIKILVILTLSLTSSQAQNLTAKINTSEVKIENIKIEVEVDSAEEIESTFTIDDFESLLNEADEGEELSFKIKCNGEKMSNGVKSSMSYEIKGNTSDKKTFLESIKKLREAAIKYYKSKN